MLSYEQVKALEATGRIYWQFESKDVVINPNDLPQCLSALQGLEVLTDCNGVIGLAPKGVMIVGNEGTFSYTYKSHNVTTLPMFIDSRTLKQCSYTLDLSDDCLCFTSPLPPFDAREFFVHPEDLQTVRFFAQNTRSGVVLGKSFDKPDITELAIFEGGYFESLDFTDFTGKYLQTLDDAFNCVYAGDFIWKHASLQSVSSAKNAFKSFRGCNYVNLSSLPLLSAEQCQGIFHNSSLSYQFTEEAVTTGTLQQWCKKQEA